MFERKSLIVYFRNPKVLKSLKHFGNVSYYHKKRKYAVVYIDSEGAEETLKKMQKIRHVRKVEFSLLFEENLLNNLTEEPAELIEEDEDVK